MANDHWENTDEGKAYKADAEANDDAGKRVAEVMAPELEKGFRGVEVDQTPNEAYTLAGQVAAATPETDPAAAALAVDGRAEAEQKANGVAER